MRVMRALGSAAILVISVGLPKSASGQGMCWRVPLIERQLSNYVKSIVASKNTVRQRAHFLPAAQASAVTVITDTATCRLVATAHQRAVFKDSLAAPHPIVLLRSGDPSTPATVRYVIWDNVRLGEWSAVSVYDADLRRLGGWGW